MNLIVRQAELKDSEHISRLCSQLGYETTIEKLLKRLSEILNNSDNFVFVVLENESLIGWIHALYTLRLESDSFVEIGGMLIDEHFRNKGLGKVLIEKVTDWARSKNCGKIRVRSNTIRNDTHQFYLKTGFSEIKEQKIFDLLLK